MGGGAPALSKRSVCRFDGRVTFFPAAAVATVPAALLSTPINRVLGRLVSDELAHVAPSLQRTAQRRRRQTGTSGERMSSYQTDYLAAACASADGVWQPTIAGASWTSSSSSSACTMNRAKSTRRVMLLSRIGSPTCRLHTGRP